MSATTIRLRRAARTVRRRAGFGLTPSGWVFTSFVATLAVMAGCLAGAR